MNTYEILLVSPSISATSWEALLKVLLSLHHSFASFRLLLCAQNHQICYYLSTPVALPTSLQNLPDFLIIPSSFTFPLPTHALRPVFTPPSLNFSDLRAYLLARKSYRLTSIQITFLKFSAHSSHCYIQGSGPSDAVSLPNTIPAHLLAIDFQANRHLARHTTPKYLDSSKLLPHLSPSSKDAIFKIDTFPYSSESLFLPETSVDFAKHSLVFGTSGSGKSRFLSLLVQFLHHRPTLAKKYHFVIIDPHAALEQDIGAFAKIFDFTAPSSSLNLFASSGDNPILSVELLLDVFRGLITNYNPKLERVLRHSLFLLLSTNQFNFQTLRELLLNLEFRTQALNQAPATLPINTRSFFQTEFTELKTHSYSEAIAPIISLLDELEMLPALNSAAGTSLSDVISHNFLTIFSLSRIHLGDHIVQTISSLIMQQLLTLIYQRTFSKHLIFIIDEVALVQNPILERFLSEARKFNLSLILAGQYFQALSSSLQSAIFANTINYYLFRLSKDDAALLAHQIDFKIPLDDTIDRKVKTLTTLENRECLLRLSIQDQLFPGVKAATLDCPSFPRPAAPVTFTSSPASFPNSSPSFTFIISPSCDFHTVLKSTSTSRKSARELQKESHHA